MKKFIMITAITFIVLAGQPFPAWARMATKDEIRTVANNWISLIIQKKGDWGGHDSVKIEDIHELKREERIIGYFCRVNPRGFIIISLHKELAPIKAYSATSDLNPESEKGMADVIKSRMERVLTAVQQQLSPSESLATRDISNALEINYSQAWDELTGNAESFKKDLQSGVLELNYQAGDVLLSSAWHQSLPYNDDTPWMNCNNSNGRALVGCVATAGAQIIRYWNWPPYGVNPSFPPSVPRIFSDSYDWRNMHDRVEISSPQAQIDAVAELSYEVGVAVGMDYGCDESGAYTDDMEFVYEAVFRYANKVGKAYRIFFDAAGWFNLIKNNLNLNRPTQYRVDKHSIVYDGWQEIGSQRQYHMNYGWGQVGTCDNGCNTWYTLDGLHLGGDGFTEYMLVDIYPASSIGSSLSGNYSRQSFPYRYFDQDATGSSATFLSGQYLQFLPNITVQGTSATNTVKVEGSNSLNTRLFTRGDMTQGIRIYNGAITLRNHGGMRFY